MTGRVIVMRAYEPLPIATAGVFKRQALGAVAEGATPPTREPVSLGDAGSAALAPEVTTSRFK
jgi:hypothetical protein